MDEFKVKITNLSKDYKTAQAVITMTAAQSVLPELEKLINVEQVCKISKPRKKRSKNANAYLWELLGKLEAELCNCDETLTKDELYKGYIRSYGKSEEWEIVNQAIPDITAVWRNNGLGWNAEKVDDGENGMSLIRFYYGSSAYNTAEMARLLNAVITDCEAVGIPTITPKEAEELAEKWGNRDNE